MSNLEQILIYGALALLIVIIALGLFRHKKISAIKIILNIFLVISILPLIFNWKVKSKTDNIYLIYDNRLPRSYLVKLKDTEKINAAVDLKKFRNQYLKKQTKYSGKILFAGNSFNAKDIAEVAGNKIEYLPFFGNDSLRSLNWKGVLSPYEGQEINGAIFTNSEKWLKVKYGSITLDSVKVNGLKDFRFKFQGLGFGRSSINLVLDDFLLEECNFFVQKPKPQNILILNQSADFESKTLASWLAKQGHRVLLKSIITKGNVQTLSLNAPQSKAYDWVICNTYFLNQSEVRNAIKENKGVLLMGVSEKDVQNVKKTLAVNASIVRTSNEEEIELIPGLYSKPFKVIENHRILNKSKYPIYFISPGVVISLITESYPLMLSGDSLNYGSVWKNTIAYLYKDSGHNYKINYPLISDGTFDYQVNAKGLKVQYNNYPLDSNTKILKTILPNTGWQVLNDSIDIFVPVNNPVYLSSMKIKSWISDYSGKKAGSVASIVDVPIEPTWKWIFPFLCLILLWVEPKISKS
jgi:hypothetical protein